METSIVPILISVHAARKMLGIGHTKIYQLIENKDIKSVKIGSRRMVIVSSVHDLVARLVEAASDEAA